MPKNVPRLLSGKAQVMRDGKTLNCLTKTKVVSQLEFNRICSTEMREGSSERPTGSTASYIPRRPYQGLGMKHKSRCKDHFRFGITAIKG